MYFAVFAVAPVSSGLAATTRAADRGEAGRIGLPGGKVDPGETPVEALIRECAEEGWSISGVEETPCHVALVEGRPVAWFYANHATLLSTYKEVGRISPIVATRNAVADSGYGNEWLK